MKRFLLAFAATALAAPVLAQDWKGAGRLQGKVTDPDGKGIANATVKLDCPTRGGGTTVTTDKKGNWAYLGLVGCSWNVDVAAEGFVTKAMVVNMASEQSRMPPVNIQLDKPQGPPPELLEAVKKGDEAFAAKNWKLARENYEKVLEMRPDLGQQVYQKLAQAYAGEGNSVKAVEYLEKSIAADPSRVDLRFAAAQSALESGLTDKGMELLASIDETQVKGPDGYFNLAVYFLRAADSQKAIEYFSKAIARDEKLSEAYYWRGMSYIRENQVAEARADMQKVIDIDPAGESAGKARNVLEQLK
jgi:tetratricopeptide (TPR) repeat protein